MNYMVWNARGTGARSFLGLMRDLKIHYQLGFVAILETRCAKEVSKGRAQQMGFSNFEIVECEGYSGGIWCLWDDSIGVVSVLERNQQYLHFQIVSNAGVSWNLTVVYASPNCVIQRLLWDNLTRLASTMQGPWLLGGDLNGTLTHCERRSTATFRRSVDRDFLHWFDSRDLMDRRRFACTVPFETCLMSPQTQYDRDPL
ncbi:hypothetical protein K1719_000081 [Acacia pycnantha]|nr:hypothetical protein K1719_000081 [Acacia pycnantha]